MLARAKIKRNTFEENILTVEVLGGEGMGDMSDRTPLKYALREQFVCYQTWPANGRRPKHGPRILTGPNKSSSQRTTKQRMT